MPEKTNSAKRRSSVAQTLDRFLERVRDEPEHAAHFAQKIPKDPADLLERNYRRRDQNFFGRVLFFPSHFKEEAAPVQETKKRFLLAGVLLDRGLSVRTQEIYVGAMFSNLRTGRGRSISSCATLRQDEFNERK